jgi:ferrochelatase
MLVMSFHGVPRFTLTKGDPYHCECQKTARLLAETLELSSAEHRVTFQSRFGRAEWLQPYTQATVEQFARDGTPRVDVICPGFVSDCLETLEEVALECKAAFLASGGKQFNYIPCLNEQDEWIEALRTVVAEHLGTWLTGAPPAPEELARRRERALALGATQ